MTHVESNGETSSEVTELNPFQDAIAENSWYWGCADSSMNIRGIDYGSMSSGAGQVEDEARHDARILAPLEPSFRFGLWRRAWVELVLGAIESKHVYLLRLAFEPRGFAWDGDLPRRPTGEAQPGRVLDEVDLFKAETPKPRPLWENDLRDALRLEGYAYRGQKARKGSKKSEEVLEPTYAVNLIEVGLFTGAVERAAVTRPDWADLRDLHGGLSREGLLKFLRQVASDARATITDGKGQKARSLLDSIRAMAGSDLMPALRAYSEARGKVDQERHPYAVLRSETKRRHAERWNSTDSADIRRRAEARAARLQAVSRG